MHYTDAIRWYRAALRRDPATPAPAARMEPPAAFREWKQEMRAFDAVRIELKLATPEQIQAANAAVPVPRGGARILQHPQYVLP